jgi:hypothetical protein
MNKWKANNYKGTGKSKPNKNAMKKALSKKSSLKAKNPLPVYKSGMMNGKPMDYSKMKKGIITSID